MPSEPGIAREFTIRTPAHPVPACQWPSGSALAADPLGPVQRGGTVVQAVCVRGGRCGKQPVGRIGAVTASNDRRGRRFRAASAVCWWPGSAGGRPDRPATGARMLGRLRWAAVMTARRWACPGPRLARSTIDRPGYGESPSPLARSRELGDQTVPSVPIQSGVAQSAERPAVNRRVESSSLSPRAVSSAPRNQVMRSSGRGSGWPGRTRHGQGLDPAPGPSRRNGGARGE